MLFRFFPSVFIVAGTWRLQPSEQLLKDRCFVVIFRYRTRIHKKFPDATTGWCTIYSTFLSSSILICFSRFDGLLQKWLVFIWILEILIRQARCLFNFNESWYWHSRQYNSRHSSVWFTLPYEITRMPIFHDYSLHCFEFSIDLFEYLFNSAILQFFDNGKAGQLEGFLLSDLLGTSCCGSFSLIHLPHRPV